VNAVWLNDELMVTPGVVVGLELLWDAPYWVIHAVTVTGEVRTVWSSDSRFTYRYEQRAEAEAEMARLSELLWPTQRPVDGFQAQGIPLDSVVRDAGFRGLIIEIPEGTDFEGGDAVRVYRAKAHPGAVPDAGRSCGSMSNAGYRCVRYYGHHLNSPHMDDAGRTWTHSDHI
jgi:hypothetical protein